MPILLSNEDYTVGWICALPVELAAAQTVLDERHEPLPARAGDANVYAYGRIHDHNVVVACLPAGLIGTNSAASVAMHMHRSFGCLRFALMVGIGGGVPSKAHDIRLGDVVVGQPVNGYGGVIQYDFGKSRPNGFERTGFLNAPPAILLSAVSMIRAKHSSAPGAPSSHMLEKGNIATSARPSVDTDILYEVAMDDAEPRIIQRPPRSNLDVEVHYGTIASGNQVMRHAAERDQVSREFGGVLCFEMEAAGLMNNFPSLVIRGICDYADVHKTKNWQEFAAATAAGYAKQLLCEVPRAEVVKIGAVNDRSGMKNRIVSLPFQRNYKFVGRDEILQELQKRLFLDEDCNDLAIYGLGGIGKTQIALAFANLIAKTQPDMSIFWIVALSHATVEKSFLDIAGQLRLTASSHSKEDIKIVVKHHLEDRDFGRWLLIVDNVDDESLVDLLLECVPGSDTGFKLYTSRSTRVVQDLVGGDAIEIERLGKVEALRLMSQSLLHCNAINDQTEMQSLCEELECLPLAMTQAAAYMNKNKISPGKYRELLKGADQDLIDLMSIENRDRTRYQQVGHAVATTWVVSFNQIMEQDTTAADLLKFISCVEWRDIPLPMLPKAGSNSQMTSAIGALCAYSFLTSSNHQETYNMHRLVHLATRIWVQTYDEASVIHTAVMAHMGAVFPPALWQNRADWRAFHPHAARLLRDYNGREDKGVARLCHSVGKSLLADWRTEEAIHWLETSQEVLIGLSDGDEYLLEVHHDLAEAWCDIHQELKAVQLLENVVAKRRSVLAEHHIDLVRSEILLADVYRSVGRWEEGLAMLERAAAHVTKIESQKLVEDDLSRLTSMHWLGRAYMQVGDSPSVFKALLVLQQVVSIRTRALAESDPYRLASEQELARAYLQTGWREATALAIELLEHVVEVDSKNLKDDDTSRAFSRSLLNEAYAARERLQQKDGKRNHESRRVSPHALNQQVLKDPAAPTNAPQQPPLRPRTLPDASHPVPPKACLPA
ncbi:hypothetical protein M409DRAFT_66037 [Zasmidium cellare ATCC 36951]|uniref:NB-ARC domain-containing protein n=1 Tax=Zasmidium cellare ATCC 36951 TaxID=1080233 RepID=A0A6A6CJR5_ZASCE|nr:uncharacterized protein M409DRAFT_66037 [Zasmidium cellare ATCC 36951]KAF2167467.1 hypothetical protein M409DRAFT_66037 [Zasmidium cellare ATCC 36951]